MPFCQSSSASTVTVTCPQFQISPTQPSAHNNSQQFSTPTVSHESTMAASYSQPQTLSNEPTPQNFPQIAEEDQHLINSLPASTAASTVHHNQMSFMQPSICESPKASEPRQASLDAQYASTDTAKFCQIQTTLSQSSPGNSSQASKVVEPGQGSLDAKSLSNVTSTFYQPPETLLIQPPSRNFPQPSKPGNSFCDVQSASDPAMSPHEQVSINQVSARSCPQVFKPGDDSCGPQSVSTQNPVVQLSWEKYQQLVYQSQTYNNNQYANL